MLAMLIAHALFPIAISLVVFSSTWLITANLPHRTESERRSGTRVATGLFLLACLLFVVFAFGPYVTV
ncbi:hypothetical protein [Planomonospora parontospora]|uniref:hypothetical protein n=1 Tax=Planomonospora parontospora TaxID=58119 RepID=UPI00166F9903|nr:hypothetical protein [Planomonospora parontospora]GGL41026.1 hypothetical protein GCM10014719_47850 [Planomonospora parontospora subsp. antibiotica]GII17914.1 hypothetical protein Ppa05_46400 [Planomonospora parontospora subsp. antibiotica]